MKLNENKTHLYLVLIFGLALLIGVGYALLTSNLNIFGQTTIQKASWDVHFENIKVTDGSVTATTPSSIDANSTTVNYTVSLNMPGDYYEFTVDEVNKGTIDAMVSNIVTSGLTESQAKYINYSVTYSDGTIVSEKQLLAAGGKETVKVRVEFKKDITAQDLPTTETTLNLSFSINYVQADDSAVAIRSNPVCQHATALHNDGTNTYGSLGTSGTLKSGDAFDCDVNGDGVYDSETERFYYVLDLDTNNDYSVLIYYSNIAEGVVNNTIAYDYKTGITSGGGIFYGPDTAKLQLPTTSQWSNVSLANTNRDIKNNNGDIKVNGFSYEGYAARFLTYQEVYNGCYDGVKNLSSSNSLNTKCKYLLENTSSNSNDQRYYWLETLCTLDNCAYVIDGPLAALINVPLSHRMVRPAIEVPTSKISY